MTSAPTAVQPRMIPMARGVTTAISPGATMSLKAAFVEISTAIA